MGLFSRSSSESRQELRDARANLQEISSGITEETDDYYAANDRVLAAEKAVKDSRRR